MAGRGMRYWLLTVAAVGAGSLPGAASAQVGRGPYGPAAGFTGNPYANPYMNPFLNPALMAQSSMGSRDAALYFFAAQQSLGGIGSGQLSGVRSARGPAPAVAPRPAGPANSSMVPGGNAAHYFNRTAMPTGTGPHYNRQGRYFPKISR